MVKAVDVTDKQRPRPLISQGRSVAAGPPPRSAQCLLLVALLSLPSAGLAAPVILVLGDSLSAAHGIDQSDGWVRLLERRLEANGYGYRVVNASISGETTRGALSRVAGELERHRPALVVIELGANDGLRGLPIAEIEANLASLIERVQARGAVAVLAGMRLPPNYGAVYTREFAAVYRRLSERYAVALVPFLLEGFADRKDLFQSDGIHPLAAAQPMILENVWVHLKPLLISPVAGLPAKNTDGPRRAPADRVINR